MTKQTISINGTLVTLGEHEQADGDVAFGMFVALSPEDARAIAEAGHLLERVRVTLEEPAIERNESASQELVLMAVAVEYDAGGGRMQFGGKIEAIRQIRMEIPGLGLKEGKTLVESAPVSIGRFPTDKAERLAANLRQYGATVELKP